MRTLLLLLLLLPWTSIAIADETDPPPVLTMEQADRLEELRREIETFLEQVPPQLREAVRQRLLASLGPAPAPPPAEEPPPEPTPAKSPIGVAQKPTPPPQPTVAAPPPEPPATEEPPAEEPPAEEPPRRARRERCNTLEVFDENDDGRVTVTDRYWRYLYLWSDANGDGRVIDDEIESAYEAGVREISNHLQTFARKKKGLGEIRRERGLLLFDVRGNGFGGPDDGALAIDTTALARSNGPQILDAEGQPVEGIQPIRKSWGVRMGDEVVVFNCP